MHASVNLDKPITTGESVNPTVDLWCSRRVYASAFRNVHD